MTKEEIIETLVRLHKVEPAFAGATEEMDLQTLIGQFGVGFTLPYGCR